MNLAESRPMLLVMTALAAALLLCSFGLSSTERLFLLPMHGVSRSMGPIKPKTSIRGRSKDFRNPVTCAYGSRNQGAI